jgi:hypothetical protein
LATTASALTRPLDKATSATARKDTKEIHTFNTDAKVTKTRPTIPHVLYHPRFQS